MQTVFIDVGEELNRLVAISNLAPITHLNVIEQLMLHIRESEKEANFRGAQHALDLIQAVRELKSAAGAYQKYIIELADRLRDPPAGDASA